jgi:hypothetical protein
LERPRNVNGDDEVVDDRSVRRLFFNASKLRFPARLRCLYAALLFSPDTDARRGEEDDDGSLDVIDGAAVGEGDGEGEPGGVGVDDDDEDRGVAIDEVLIEANADVDDAMNDDANDAVTLRSDLPTLPPPLPPLSLVVVGVGLSLIVMQEERR